MYKKELGQYMTPETIVNIILDTISYNGKKILNQRIIEPSFGEGAFLKKIVKRLILECKKNKKNTEEICKLLETNIYGIEKDEKLYRKCLISLNQIIQDENLPEVNWNLYLGDTLLLYDNFKNFDYVVGNPPFVRIHLLSDEYKDIMRNFNFSEGMMDLYVVFYEIGLKMLCNTGKLCFITPNSFTYNHSQKKFRDYLLENKLITDYYDFKDIQLFNNILTYDCICMLQLKNNKKELKYRYYKTFSSYSEDMLLYVDIDGRAWNLHNKEDVQFLKLNRECNKKLSDLACIENGIVTNRDKIYIVKVFDDENCTIPYTGKKDIVYIKKDKIYPIETKILHPCIKESKCKRKIDEYIIFPYNGIVPFSEEELITKYPLAYQYLLSQKEELLKRDLKGAKWFEYGRKQGLKNSNKKKLVFSHIVNTKLTRIQPYIYDENVIVYSGIYITAETDETLETIYDIVSSEDFAKYCYLSGRSMSGNYVGLNVPIISNFGIQE